MEEKNTASNENTGFEYVIEKYPQADNIFCAEFEHRKAIIKDCLKHELTQFDKISFLYNEYNKVKVVTAAFMFDYYYSFYDSPLPDNDEEAIEIIANKIPILGTIRRNYDDWKKYSDNSDDYFINKSVKLFITPENISIEDIINNLIEAKMDAIANGDTGNSIVIGKFLTRYENAVLEEDEEEFSKFIFWLYYEKKYADFIKCEHQKLSNTNPLQYEDESEIKLKWHKSKIDLIRILTAIHRLDMVRDKNGYRIEITTLMREVGKFFNVNLNKYSDNLTQTFDSPNPYKLNTRVFDTLKEEMNKRVAEYFEHKDC